MSQEREYSPYPFPQDAAMIRLIEALESEQTACVRVTKAPEPVFYATLKLFICNV